MLTRIRAARNDSGESRNGVPLVFNKYTYRRRPEPPVLTLAQLRAEHERLIAPLLNAETDNKSVEPAS
jgi:hypothetical protein